MKLLDEIKYKVAQEHAEIGVGLEACGEFEQPNNLILKLLKVHEATQIICHLEKDFWKITNNEEKEDAEHEIDH